MFDHRSTDFYICTTVWEDNSPGAGPKPYELGQKHVFDTKSQAEKWAKKRTKPGQFRIITTNCGKVVSVVGL